METNSALLLLKKYQAYRYSLKKVFLQAFWLSNHQLSVKANYTGPIKRMRLPLQHLLQVLVNFDKEYFQLVQLLSNQVMLYQTLKL